jgi:hypothetical protein
MPVTAFHGNGLISQLEILRGDLVGTLYRATKDRPSHYPHMAKAGLACRSESIDGDRHDLAQQRRILDDRLAGKEWQCDELLAAAADADDLCSDGRSARAPRRSGSRSNCRTIPTVSNFVYDYFTSDEMRI